MAENQDQGIVFTIATDPFYFAVGAINQLTLAQANLTDNAFDYFPYAHIFVSDQTGVFAETYQFIETLNMTLSMKAGPMEKASDRISYDFYWTRDEIQNPTLNNHINGTHIWQLISKTRKIDSIKSKAYGTSSAQLTGINLSSVIQGIVAPYNFSSTLISGMDNTDIYYQANIEDFVWINRLTGEANPRATIPSPFLSFINLQNEFYFATLKDLLDQKVDDSCKYVIDVTQLQSLELDKVQRYTTLFAGADLTEPYYNRNTYYLDESGNYQRQKFYLSDYLNTTQVDAIGNANNQTFTLRASDMSKFGLKSVKFLGLKDNANQLSNVKGRIHQQVINALIPYRMTIVVPYNPIAVSGHTVEINVQQAADDSSYSKVYAGKWLIYRSDHEYRTKYRSGYSTLYLCRHTVEVDRNNKPRTDPSNQFVKYVSLSALDRNINTSQ